MVSIAAVFRVRLVYAALCFTDTVFRLSVNYILLV